MSGRELAEELRLAARRLEALADVVEILGPPFERLAEVAAMMRDAFSEAITIRDPGPGMAGADVPIPELVEFPRPEPPPDVVPARPARPRPAPARARQRSAPAFVGAGPGRRRWR